MIAAILLFPLLLLMTAFEIVKRVVGLILFPFAYAQRDTHRVNHKAGKASILYWFLDDSINEDSKKRDKPETDYCCYGKREPLGFITERLPAGRLQEFARAYNWSAWRNSAINLRDKMAVGPMLESWWKRGTKSFYEVRIFENRALPYLELWFGGYRLQAGFLSGQGQWQVQFRKLK